MKILILSSVFPPKIIGGAELSAYNLGVWLSRRGHEIGVLTVAEKPSDELKGELVDGMRVWRLCWPRTHTQHQHRRKSAASKLVWHLQDYLDPRNGRRVREVLEEFRPDAINVHLLSGIGHNVMSEVGRYGAPVLYFLHDLVLVCFRSNMYKRGRNCERQCLTCGFSSAHALRKMRGVSALQFVSPSKSNLETAQAFANLGSIPAHVVANVDLDEMRELVPRAGHVTAKFLYVGKLDIAKGAEFLLRVLDELARTGTKFHLTVVGGGPLEARLRSTYQNRPWVTFEGKVPPVEVRRFLDRADVLLLPSLWRENHPGVVRQALRAGITAVVSDVGGSKEMIRDGETGIVLRAGDESSWKSALALVSNDQEMRLRLQEGARIAGAAYSADALGERILKLIEDGVKANRAPRPTPGLLQITPSPSRQGGE